MFKSQLNKLKSKVNGLRSGPNGDVCKVTEFIDELV